MFYLTGPDDRPEGWAGLDNTVGNEGNALLAIDYRTGKIAWRHDWYGGNGIVHNLSTAGNLLFTSNALNFIAFQASTGKILWHTALMETPTAGPITYMLDARQHVVIAAGDSLYCFRLNQPAP